MSAFASIDGWERFRFAGRFGGRTRSLTRCCFTDARAPIVVVRAGILSAEIGPARIVLGEVISFNVVDFLQRHEDG